MTDTYRDLFEQDLYSIIQGEDGGSEIFSFWLHRALFVCSECGKEFGVGYGRDVEPHDPVACGRCRKSNSGLRGS